MKRCAKNCISHSFEDFFIVFRPYRISLQTSNLPISRSPRLPCVSQLIAGRLQQISEYLEFFWKRAGVSSGLFYLSSDRLLQSAAVPYGRPRESAPAVESRSFWRLPDGPVADTNRRGSRGPSRTLRLVRSGTPYIAVDIWCRRCTFDAYPSRTIQSRIIAPTTGLVSSCAARGRHHFGITLTFPGAVTESSRRHRH